MLLTIDEVNSMSYEDFMSRFGNVVERCPIIAGITWSSRPFSSFEHICQAFSEAIDGLSFKEKVAMLRCLPDLAGRLARQGKLSVESTKEQGSAGLLSLSQDEQKSISAANERYKNKFRFPFVLCARQNKKDVVYKGLMERVENTVEAEVETGIREAKDIGKLRLTDIVKTGCGCPSSKL